MEELEDQSGKANSTDADVSTPPTPKSGKPEIRVVQVIKGGSMVSILLHGMSAAADVKVFINDLDVSSLIGQQSEDVLALQAKYEKFNLKPGKNEIYVIVDGVKSEPYVFKQF